MQILVLTTITQLSSGKYNLTIACCILLNKPFPRFSTLPPEFTHELPQHLASPDVPKDSLTGLPIMDFDNYCCGAHGLSILIASTLPDLSLSL